MNSKAKQIIIFIMLGLIITAGLVFSVIFLLRNPNLSIPADDTDGTVMVTNNTSENPLYVYITYANFNKNTDGSNLLNPPSDKWRRVGGSGGGISDPISFYPENNPPEGATPPFHDPNDVGSSTWQIISLEQGKSILLSIPNFTPQQAWSIRPLKYRNGLPCNGGVGDCGKPILIEGGKEMVADMSAVDGVNFKCEYNLTTPDGETEINFNSNPCKAVGLNPAGCVNPYVDGLFADLGSKCDPGNGNCWHSAPCPAGTCNLIGTSKNWCDAIHEGQCANSSSTWGPEGEHGGPPSCRNFNKFTTYCYSHDDASSSPAFASPYNMRVIYRDLM